LLFPNVVSDRVGYLKEKIENGDEKK